MSLIEKIDAEINRLKIERERTIWKENKRIIDIKILEACEIKQIILSEQKEPYDIPSCQDCAYELTKQCDVNCKADTMRYKFKQKEPLTIGDKIRESNESLAEFIENVLYQCINRQRSCGGCELITACSKSEGHDNMPYLDYLNQPSTGTE